MSKLFGTDGIRGVFGKDVLPETAFHVGRAAVRKYGRGDYLIARDTRVSGSVLLESLVKGINTECGSAISLGILPISALAYFTKKYNAKCGIMISASRYAPEYNGIKVFNSHGLKLDENEEARFESFLNDMVDREGVPAQTKVASNALVEYVDYVKSFSTVPLDGIVVRLDCAYGACSNVASMIFESLGARVVSYNDAYMGSKINVDCGLRHPEFLLSKMKSENEIGFVFDGDGDSLRVISGGRVMDGDSVLYALSRCVPLAGGVVVGTSLNNLALERALANDGLKLVRTGVGNKYITRELCEHGYRLGGEQNGHYIVRGECVTSDALVAAVCLLNGLCADGRVQRMPSLVLYPQATQTYAASRAVMKSAELCMLTQQAERALGSGGRVVVRMSGMGSRVRVMVESRDEAVVEEWHTKFRETIERLNAEVEADG